MTAIQRLHVKINSMSVRERQSLLAGLVLAIPILFWGTYLDGQNQRQQKIEKSTRAKNVEIAKLEGLLRGKGKGVASDPALLNKAAQENLHREIDTLRAALSANNGALVSAERAPRLFEQVIKLRGPLRLVAVKTLPPASPTRDAKTTAPGSADVIYQHGIELVLQGDPAALLSYLKKLESLPSPLHWDKAVLRPDAGDKSMLTLNFHTLSLEAAWVKL